MVLKWAKRGCEGQVDKGKVSREAVHMGQTQVITRHTTSSQPSSAPFPLFHYRSLNLQPGKKDEWIKVHHNLRSADDRGFSAAWELLRGPGQLPCLQL